MVQSWTRVESKNLIPNQFNFNWWNHEKNQFKKLAKAKKIAIKRMMIKFDREKN
jgi:hypothetical protein